LEGPVNDLLQVANPTTNVAFPAIQVLIAFLAGTAILQFRYTLASNPALPRERALRFFAAALGAWVCMGMTQIAAVYLALPDGLKNGLLTVFSGASDLFVILLVTQLEHAPAWIRSQRIPGWPFALVGGGWSFSGFSPSSRS